MLTLFWKTRLSLPSHLYFDIVKLFFSAFLRTNRIAKNRKNENCSIDALAFLMGIFQGVLSFRKVSFIKSIVVRVCFCVF